MTAAAGTSSVRPPLDLRLVVPVAAVWAGAALAGRWPASTGLLIAAAVCGGLVPLAGVRLMVHRRPARAGPGSRACPAASAGRPVRRALVLSAVAGLAAGVFVAGVDGQDRHGGALAQLAERSVAAEAELVVTDDPRIVGGGPAGSLTVVPARLVRLAAGAGGSAVELRLEVPVLVLTQDGGWSPLLPSTRVAARGRLGPPRPGDTVGAVLLARGPPRIIAGPSRHQRIAGALRARLRAAASVLPEPADGLFPALVVGDVSRLDPDLRADFRTAGMTHLTAVSGGNLAILCGVVLAALRRTRIGIRSRALWVAVVIIGFVVLARPSASVLRAAVMGLIGVLAVSSGRGSSVLPALAAAVGLLVLVQPGLALSAGFALSVLATGGIVVLGPGWRAALGRRLPDRLAEVVAVAAAAQLACTPVLAWIGGGISLVAIPANVAAVVAVPPITVLGVVALAVSPVSDPCARVVVWLAGWPCRWLVGVARIAADVPGGTLHWPDGPVGALVALAALPAALAALRRPRTRRLAAAATAGLLVARLVLAPRLAPWPPPGWRLVACDVGQGDALVLGAGDGSGVLVDAGPDPDAVRRCLDELRIRWLPLIVLTHLHADHVEGLAAVLGHRPVGTIVTTPLHEPAAQWSRVRGWARQADVPISDAAAGQTLTVGPLSLRVLGPVRVLHGTNSDPNNASVVLLARSGGLTMLLTGDAEGPEQRQVLGTGALGPTAGGRPGGGATAGGGAAGGGAVHLDVLKVAHHGSADQSPGMLAATGARVALISVGVGNDYGHPASSTLAALAAAGITVARTDRNGSAAVLPGPRGPLVVVRRPAG